jgi:hypothetical protein
MAESVDRLPPPSPRFAISDRVGTAFEPDEAKPANPVYCARIVSYNIFITFAKELAMSKDLKTAFSEMHDHIRSKVKPDWETLDKFEESGGNLGGAIDQDISIAVHNGIGFSSTDKITSFWVTLTGFFMISEPPDGSWHLRATDMAQGKTIIDIPNALCGKQYDFSYKTGFKCQIKVEVWWSEQKDTTLKAHIHGKY